MKFPWGQADSSSKRRPSGAPESAPEAQSCPALSRILEKVLKREKARILDLGPLCGDSAVYLAGRGARVSVEEFEPPPPPPPRDPRRPHDAGPPQPPLKIDQEDRSFDLVLAWEQVDFVPPERLSEFGNEVRRVLAPGGYALMFARNVAAGDDDAWRRAGRYRVIADDRVIREHAHSSVRKRWVHPTRDIERALAPLVIEGVHLQRNQVREFLAKRGAS